MEFTSKEVFPQEEVLTNNKKGNGSESNFRKTLSAFLQIELVSRQVFSVKVYEFYRGMIKIGMHQK